MTNLYNEYLTGIYSAYDNGYDGYWLLEYEFPNAIKLRVLFGRSWDSFELLHNGKKINLRDEDYFYRWASFNITTADKFFERVKNLGISEEIEYTEKSLMDEHLLINCKYDGDDWLFVILKHKKAPYLWVLFWYKKIWRKPIFTGGIPQLSSAMSSLTSVFGMGTGGTSHSSSPEMLCV